MRGNQPCWKIDRFTLIKINEDTKTRYKHLFGRNPKFVNFLKTWGEAGMAKQPMERKKKLSNRGEDGMFVGHA